MSHQWFTRAYGTEARFINHFSIEHELDRNTGVIAAFLFLQENLRPNITHLKLPGVIYKKKNIIYNIF
jgi:hypothetical protein